MPSQERAQSMRPAIPVAEDNFTRAETHLYFGNAIKARGAGKFHHWREVMSIDNQTVIRASRDTLYAHRNLRVSQPDPVSQKKVREQLIKRAASLHQLSSRAVRRGVAILSIERPPLFRDDCDPSLRSG